MFLKLKIIGTTKRNWDIPIEFRIQINMIESYYFNKGLKIKLAKLPVGVDSSMTIFILCPDTHSIEELDAKLLHYNPVAELLYSKNRE